MHDPGYIASIEASLGDIDPTTVKSIWCAAQPGGPLRAATAT